MKTLLKHLLVLSTMSLQNSYCTDVNNIDVTIEKIDSSNFNTEYLQSIVQDSNDIYHSIENNKHYVFDKQSSKYIIFSSQQLSNTINEIFANTNKKIYRIIYNLQKLSFILNNNDLNIFKNIDNIVKKIMPLCEEYSIANLGPKPILYGPKVLEGILPTINNQFINGLNFQIDLTKTIFRTVDDFLKCYEKMFLQVPILYNCIDCTLLGKLISQVDYYINAMNYIKCCLNNTNNNSEYLSCNNTKNSNMINIIDERISIIRNLHDFLNLNEHYITENLKQIFDNGCNILSEALDVQYQEIDINELLNTFFNKLDNINNLPENERQDLLRAFIRNTLTNMYVHKLILLLEDIEIINKFKYFLNRNDIKQFSFHDLFADHSNHTWDEVISDCEILDTMNGSNTGKSIVKTPIEKKIEMYYEKWLMFCNEYILGTNLSIKRIQNNKNNNIKELKKIMLEYLGNMKTYLLNETKKYETIMNNNESLVPINFWKQKQIDFKTC